jgi:hypothetical protein
LVLYLELTLFSIPMFLLIAARSSAAALSVSGGLWLVAQIYPDLLPRIADHSYFNPMAWQFIFCIGMFVGTWYNSEELSLESFRNRPWVLLACIVVGAGLLYQFARLLEFYEYLSLGTLAGSDATRAQMKESLSAIRLLHFLSVALLVAMCVRPSSPILSWPGAGTIIKSGRSSLQIFCVGAVLSVMLNLFVAVAGPDRFERVILDCAAILLVAWIASVLWQLHPDYRQSSKVQHVRADGLGTAVWSERHGFGGARLTRRPIGRTPPDR